MNILMRGLLASTALFMTCSEFSFAEVCKCDSYIGGPMYAQSYRCFKRDGKTVQGWVRMDEFLKMDRSNVENAKVDCDLLEKFTFYSSDELASAAYKQIQESKKTNSCSWEQRPSKDIPGAVMTVMPSYFPVSTADASCSALQGLPNQYGICFGISVCEGVQKGAVCLASASGKCPSASQCLNQAEPESTSKTKPIVQSGSDWGSLTYSDKKITICATSLLVVSGGKYKSGAYLGSNGKCEADQNAAFPKAAADNCFPGSDVTPTIQDYSSISGKEKQPERQKKSSDAVKSNDLT